MATGPFHGADLVTFRSLSAEIQTHFAEVADAVSPVKYRFFPRENSYMTGRVRALTAAKAVAAVTEVLRAKAGIEVIEDQLVDDSGVTLTVEAVPPPAVWYAGTDIHRVKIGFET